MGAPGLDCGPVARTPARPGNGPFAVVGSQCVHRHCHIKIRKRRDVTCDLEPWEILERQTRDNIWTRPLGKPEHKWEDIRQPQPRRLVELRSMPYADYLKTEHWRSIRRVAVYQAREKCERCGATGLLHVHHKTYENLGLETALDVEVLCPTCHRAEHGIA